MADRKKVALRGSGRMRQTGNKLVQVWLDEHEAALIELSAKSVGLPLATYVRRVAFQHAAARLDNRPALARAALEGYLPELT